MPLVKQHHLDHSHNKCQESCAHIQLDIPFSEAEVDGISPPRWCQRCKHCAECSDRNAQHSEVENAQLEAIEAKVTLDTAKQQIRVQYPFTTDLIILGNAQLNNRGQATAVQCSVENRLIKNGMMDAYNQEFKKFVDRGTLVQISP